MRSFLLIFLSIVNLNCCAQTFNRIYTNLSSQFVSNVPYDVTNSFSDGYIVAGVNQDSSGVFPFILRIDNCGNIIWYNTYPQITLAGGFIKIIRSNDGNYLALINQSIPGNLKSIMLAKIDTSGNLLWDQTYTAIADLYSLVLSQNLSGEILVTGQMYFPPAIGFLLKTDSSGNQIWLKTYASSYETADLHFLPNNIYAILYRQHTLTDDFLRILFTDSSGAPQSDILINNMGFNEYPENLFPLSNGDFIIAGQKEELTMYSLHDDQLVVRVEPSSALVWRTPSGIFHETENATAAAMLTDSSVVVVGNRLIVTNSYAFCSRIDLNGNIIDTSLYYPPYPGTSANIFYGIEETQDGGYIMVGRTQANGAGSIIWVVKVDSLGNDSSTCIATSMNEINSDSFTISPNPCSSALTVQTNKNEATEIILYDFTSRKIIQKSFTNNFTLNTEQLAKGIYFYEIRSLDENTKWAVKTGKVVKQ